MLDISSFAIIVGITTVISYIFIRRYFNIAPRYMLFASIGLMVGLTVGAAISWPLSRFFGEFGLIIAPYVLGLVVLFFTELFILEGKNIVKNARKKIDEEEKYWETRWAGSQRHK